MMLLPQLIAKPRTPKHRPLTLGIAIWIGAWPMFIVPVAMFATANWVHLPFEEAKMRRQFGAAYDDYVARVRRW
jgi:protein-S-isoprenylcysteine O-methyltransferase Ste14